MIAGDFNWGWWPSKSQWHLLYLMYAGQGGKREKCAVMEANHLCRKLLETTGDTTLGMN